MNDYFAHSRPDQPPPEWQPLEEQLRNVAELAGEFGAPGGGIFELKARRRGTMLLEVADKHSFGTRGGRPSP